VLPGVVRPGVATGGETNVYGPLPDSMTAEPVGEDELADLRKTIAQRLEQGPLLDLIALRLRAAALLSPTGGEATEVTLSECDRLLQSVVDQLTAIVNDLSGAGSSPAYLLVQLAGICAQFRLESGIECRFAVDPAHLRLSRYAEDVVRRAVRELLANVRRHARATEVAVTSRDRGECIAITVSDNGTGLPAEAQRRTPAADDAFGLWTIEQRLRELGAKLELENNSGARVSLVLPRRLLSRA